MNELCNLKPDVTVRATITGNTLGYGSLLKKNENGTYSMMFQLSDDEICYPGYLLPDDIDFNNLRYTRILCKLFKIDSRHDSNRETHHHGDKYRHNRSLDGREKPCVFGHFGIPLRKKYDIKTQIYLVLGFEFVNNCPIFAGKLIAFAFDVLIYFIIG